MVAQIQLELFSGLGEKRSHCMGGFSRFFGNFLIGKGVVIPQYEAIARFGIQGRKKVVDVQCQFLCQKRFGGIVRGGKCGNFL